MVAAWFVFQLLGGLWRRWHTPVVLWAVVGGTAPLQAGECLHLGDTACDACVVALLNAPEHWRSHEGDERFEIDGCDSHCDAACFFPKAIERLLGAKDEALADSILEAIGPYRACWDDVVPTLEILLEAHDEASAQRQRAIVLTTIETALTPLPAWNASGCPWCAVLFNLLFERLQIGIEAPDSAERAAELLRCDRVGLTMGTGRSRKAVPMPLDDARYPCADRPRRWFVSTLHGRVATHEHI